MIERLEFGPEDRVLEVGAGSGYGGAILSGVARRVYTVERRRKSAEAVRKKREPLRKQLAVGGRLVFPVGSVPERQILIRLRKQPEDRFIEKRLEAVRFLPG